MITIFKAITVTFLATALTAVPVTSVHEQYLFPPQNYRHWLKLKKVCVPWRPTYGANEFVEKGQICRWTFVPYWPENTLPVR